MRNVQFKVNTVEESHAIQKMLFESGAYWVSSGKRVEDYVNIYIGVSSGGVMTNNEFVAGNEYRYDLIDFELETTVKVVDNRPRVEIDGLTYLVSDIKQAIAEEGISPQ